MCPPSRTKPPPPPPPPAPPAPEVNAANTKLRQNAPKAPQTNSSNSSVTYSKKRGKAALRIPLQIGVGSSGSGPNIP